MAGDHTPEAINTLVRDTWTVNSGRRGGPRLTFIRPASGFK